MSWRHMLSIESCKSTGRATWMPAVPSSELRLLTRSSIITKTVTLTTMSIRIGSTRALMPSSQFSPTSLTSWSLDKACKRVTSLSWLFTFSSLWDSNMRYTSSQSTSITYLAKALNWLILNHSSTLLVIFQIKHRWYSIMLKPNSMPTMSQLSQIRLITWWIHSLRRASFWSGLLKLFCSLWTTYWQKETIHTQLMTLATSSCLRVSVIGSTNT